jgi:hypothetical protein
MLRYDLEGISLKALRLTCFDDIGLGELLAFVIPMARERADHPQRELIEKALRFEAPIEIYTIRDLEADLALIPIEVQRLFLHFRRPMPAIDRTIYDMYQQILEADRRDKLVSLPSPACSPQPRETTAEQQPAPPTSPPPTEAGAKKIIPKKRLKTEIIDEIIERHRAVLIACPDQPERIREMRKRHPKLEASDSLICKRLQMQGL